MNTSKYQFTFLVPEADRHELLTQLTQSLVGIQYIRLASDKSQVFVCQVEIQILPTVRHSKVLLYILMLHFACQEVQHPSLQQTIYHRRIYDGIAPPYLLVWHLCLIDMFQNLILFSGHNYTTLLNIKDRSANFRHPIITFGKAKLGNVFEDCRFSNVNKREQISANRES